MEKEITLPNSYLINEGGIFWFHWCLREEKWLSQKLLNVLFPLKCECGSRSIDAPKVKFIPGVLV